MNNQNFLKSVNELLNYSFCVPFYQRGYRWKKQQVEDLLNDVYTFGKTKKNDQSWYCLQPLVVKEFKNKYEVIDGQQRLTTIYLILKYLKDQKNENNINLFKIEYKTRGRSAGFLKNLEKLSNEKKYENIDFYHISTAYETIKEWFKSPNVNHSEFKKVFCDNVKVIWYEVEKEKDSTEIFTRLNSGKIPLEEAELVKALFLNKSNFERLNKEDLKDGFTLTQKDIAYEWDHIERTLQDDKFWLWLTNDNKKYANRITLILELATEEDSQNELAIFYHYFDKFYNKNSDGNIKNIFIDTWLEIKKIFSILYEYYSDWQLYHEVGFLLAIQSNVTNLKNLVNDRKEKSLNDFREVVKNKINEKLKNNNEKFDLNKIDELSYGENNDLIKNILLLHNVLTILDCEINKEQVYFPFDKYKKEKWDIEHIHARATDVLYYTKGENEDKKISQRKDWIVENYNEKIIEQDKKDDDLEKLIEQIKDTKHVSSEEIKTHLLDDKEFEKIVKYIVGEEDDSIGNLCILDRCTNRSIKNKALWKKREQIIEKDKNGALIPICSKNVFMKYYTPGEHTLYLWNKQDRENYVNDIKQKIQNYFNKSNNNQN